MNSNCSIDVHVYLGDAKVKWPRDPYLNIAVGLGDITFYARSAEHAQRIANGLNNKAEYGRDLNTSLIDAMFLIWSLRLMTNLSWPDLNGFIQEGIGIGAGTVRMLFHEADKRIAGDTAAGLVPDKRIGYDTP